MCMCMKNQCSLLLRKGKGKSKEGQSGREGTNPLSVCGYSR